MWLLHAYRTGRTLRVLQEHQVTQPRALGWLERTFLVCRPQVRRVAERFLGAIVEVVPERTDLRLKLDDGDQLPVGDDQQIPILLGAEPTRKLGPLLPVDVGSLKPRCDEQLDHEFAEPVEVFAAGDCAPVAAILAARLLALRLRLLAAPGPESS